MPALVERLIEPQLLERTEGAVKLGFSLRRSGLLGQPWPLRSYGIDWDVQVTFEIGPSGEPTRMEVTSSRDSNATSGPGSDTVEIEFIDWNGAFEVEAPTDVVDHAPWPLLCPAVS